VTLLQVPGLGPRTAGELWRQAGIDSLDALEAAARAGDIRNLKGMSAKTEEKLLDGLSSLRARPPRRMRLGTAQEIVERIAGSLRTAPGVKSVVPAGSYRRLARDGRGHRRSHRDRRSARGHRETARLAVG